MRLTKQCYNCKEQFRKTELVDYASPRSKTMYSYCPKCLKERQARDLFFDKVCTIFGLKSPGPRIWTERKRLQETYGYTDDIIIDCLDYIYCVEKKKKLAESLYLVNPTTVGKMLQYKNTKEHEGLSIAQAAQMETKEYIVPIKENNKQKKESWDPDDWLND